MVKRLIIFLFLFSIASAEFIDYSNSDLLPRMRQYGQEDPDYYMRENVQYNLETDLSIPSSQSYRWLSGSGSYSDIHDGDSVCEGQFNYQVRTNARALLSGFDGKSHTYGYGTPAGWTAYSSGSDVYVYWSNTLYNNHDNEYIAGKSTSGDLQNYGYRPVDFREIWDTAWYNNKRASVSTIMKGTSSLKYDAVGGSTSWTNVYTFAPLSGSQPSHSGSFNLYTPDYTQYQFRQRVDVTGALIGYHISAIDREYYNAFTSLDTGSSQDTYDVAHSDISYLNVYDATEVGVVPPTCEYVILDDSMPIEPGATVPATITTRIPSKGNNFPLYFEFYNIAASGGGTSFTTTSNPRDCTPFFPPFPLINGNSAYFYEIGGNLNIPDSMAPGTHTITFTTPWRTCEGQVDCNGNGDSGSDTCLITIEVVPDEPLPDLVCELEPTAYIDGIEPGPDGFAALGQGVEDWEVTVTNIGPGNATVLTPAQLLCTGVAFNSYDSDGTAEYDPIYPDGYQPLVPSVPGMIESGESVTFDFNDAPAVCLEGDAGETISAIAAVNMLDYLGYPACGPFMIIEENRWWDNFCFWSMPCIEPWDPTECTITPSNVNNPPSESTHDFTLLCDGSPCTGAVAWSETDSGADDVADMTDSDQNGATAQVMSYDPDDEVSGMTMLTATVDYPDNMVCNATITLNVNDGDPEEDTYCYCEPPPQTGYPGSYHEFEVFCVEDDEDEGHCTGDIDWDITHGEEYVEELEESGSWWANVLLNSGFMITDPDEINIRAEVEISDEDTVHCYCHILLPPMDCYDFI